MLHFDAFLLEPLRGHDSFPRRSDLDQDALAPDTLFFVKPDQLPRFPDRTFDIERVTNIRLS
jgi:hypothetical protein